MINHHVADNYSSFSESTLVDLAATNLFSNSVAEIKNLFARIEPIISHLDLSDNPFLNGAERSLSDIPTHISSVYMWFNELYEKSGPELKAIFYALTQTLFFADLSYNKLGYKRGIELKEAFSGFHPSLRSLRLSNNHIPDMNLKGLEIAFSGLPSTLETLDFSDDKSLRHINNQQLLAFLKAIPKTVRSIDLSHNKLFKGKTLEERDALLQEFNEIDPTGERLNILYNGQSFVTKLINPVSNQEQVRPKDQFNSILQQPASKPVLEKQVSKYSFFSQVNSVKELVPAPSCNFSPKP
ncbi:MAG: hypothetical protein H0U57_09060 [Tatlockia sp.]|nr:hypothetical protein [Tatlockia sp.]